MKMQKSKIATISLIIIIIIYTAMSLQLLKAFGRIYTYILNPLYWIIFSLIIIRLLGINFENTIIKKDIIQYTVIAILIYIIVNLLIGIFVGFNQNPYLNTPVGIIMNCWILGVPTICREIIRYKLVNNVYKHDKKWICCLIVITFSLIDFSVWNLFSKEIKIIYIIEQIISNYLPILMKNILLTYFASNKNLIPAIIYESIYQLFLWISPILPDCPWIVNVMVEISISIILMVYIEYVKIRFSKVKYMRQSIFYRPFEITIYAVATILLVFFAVGIFPIKPVAIASGSMEPELYIGDVAIIKECNIKDINVGDIIEYKLDNKTIIHRVTEKKSVDGIFYLTTKGDNNYTPDVEQITEKDIIGKCLFKIRKIGYLAVWFNNLMNS